MALYYANLAQTDDCVGTVLRALNELGLEDDTIVLYTSVHGEMLGEHRLWQKFVFYEPSVGVPLIFRVPGLTAIGGKREIPVSLVQVFPTLAELCGIPVPTGIDGSSLVANLLQPRQTEETTIFAEHELETSRAGSMIREGDYKYC